MERSSPSKKRILALSAGLTALGAIAISTVLFQQTVRTYRQSRQQIVTRPSIIGTMTIKGVPRAGVSLRELNSPYPGPVNSRFPPCLSLAVVARSDATGTFRAPPLTTERRYLPKRGTYSSFCLERAGQTLLAWGQLFEPNSTRAVHLRCRYPPATSEPEDHVCGYAP
jgi:hypothetical protein